MYCIYMNAGNTPKMFMCKTREAFDKQIAAFSKLLPADEAKSFLDGFNELPLSSDTTYDYLSLDHVLYIAVSTEVLEDSFF